MSRQIVQTESGNTYYEVFPNGDKQLLGYIFKRLRKDKGMNTFALDIGVDPRTYSGIGSGKLPGHHIPKRFREKLFRSLPKDIMFTEEEIMAADGYISIERINSLRMMREVSCTRNYAKNVDEAAKSQEQAVVKSYKNVNKKDKTGSVLSMNDSAVNQAKFLIYECFKDEYKSICSFCTLNKISNSVYWFYKGSNDRDKKTLSTEDIISVYKSKAFGCFVTLDMLMLAFGHVKSSDIKNIAAFLKPEDGDYIDLRTNESWEILKMMEEDGYAESKKRMTRQFLDRFKCDKNEEDPFLIMMAEKYNSLETMNETARLAETRRMLHGEKMSHNSKYEIRMDGIESIFAYI